MDPFELLKKDHKKVSGLLKQLDKTEESDASNREELFSQLKNDLETHTQIEETVFYPALEEHEKQKISPLRHTKNIMLLRRCSMNWKKHQKMMKRGALSFQC